MKNTNNFICLLIVFGIFSVSLLSCKKQKTNTTPELPPGTFVSDPITGTGGSAIHIYAKADTIINITDSSLTLHSEIIGIDASYPIIDHGHVWSTTDTNPQAFTTNNFSSLGMLNSPSTFETNIDNWYSDTKYYVRSYVKINSSLILYYPEVLEYNTGAVGTKYIDINSPTYVTSTATGTLIDINWLTNTTGNVKIDLFKNEVFISTLAENYPNKGLFKWVIPTSLQSGNDYQIRISDLADFTIYDLSDKFRILTNIFISLTPVSTDIWDHGLPYEISWQTNLTDQIKIELVKDLQYQQTIAPNTDNDGSFIWTVENIQQDGNDYRIKLSNVNDSNTYIYSDKFEIRKLLNYTIEIQNPIDTSVWEKGSSYTIQWFDNVQDNIKIELYKGGVFTETITANSPSSGTFQWTVPQTLTIGADYTIKITDIADPSISSESAIFLIQEPGQAGIVTDYDGNQYKTVRIGYQNWMAENLRAIHYADGTPLVDGTGIGLVSSTDLTKYYFYYDDNPANEATFGRLYSWTAATNNGIQGTQMQGICPTGWHLPSNTEFETLSTYLGGNTVSGGKLKEAGSKHWLYSNAPGTNITNFTALPSGNRNQNGTYSGNLQLSNNLWTASENDATTAWVRALLYNEKTFNFSNLEKTKAFSVRCIQNAK